MTERFTVSIDPEHQNIFHYSSKDLNPPEPVIVPLQDISMIGLITYGGTLTMRALEAVSCIGLKKDQQKKI